MSVKLNLYDLAAMGCVLNRYANAKALVSKEEILKVKSWPLNKIRDLANGQIELAKRAFTKASDIAWYQGVYMRWINNTRWSPYLQQIKDAEESFIRGENSNIDFDKKEHYISAWTTAKLSVVGISKEADFGETNFTYLADDLSSAAKKALTPYAEQAANISKLITVGLIGIGGLFLYNKFKNGSK